MCTCASHVYFVDSLFVFDIFFLSPIGPLLYALKIAVSGSLLGSWFMAVSTVPDSWQHPWVPDSCQHPGMVSSGHFTASPSQQQLHWKNSTACSEEDIMPGYTGLHIFQSSTWQSPAQVRLFLTPPMPTTAGLAIELLDCVYRSADSIPCEGSEPEDQDVSPTVLCPPPPTTICHWVWAGWTRWRWNWKRLHGGRV